jgi:cytochrome c-type protein NapC
MRWITRPLRWFWNVLWAPAGTLGLGFLTLGGFIGGVIFWGAFNTALEITNTEEFCISCHEMEANVYEEMSRTIHFSNRSGVRASCPACHVPHEWTDKIARKMQASKEVWRVGLLSLLIWLAVLVCGRMLAFVD